MLSIYKEPMIQPTVFIYNFRQAYYHIVPIISSFSDYCRKSGKNGVCDGDLLKKYIFAPYKQNYTTCQTLHQELRRSSLTN